MAGLNTPMTDKQALKAERVKQFFIEACQRIILNDGVEHATIRRVADEAGYSYGTIYNYFQDLNELLWLVRNAMVADMARSIQENVVEDPSLADNIKGLLKVYMAYHISHPTVFRFLYAHHLQPVEDPKNQGIETFNMSEGWKVLLQKYVDQGIIKADQLPLIADIILYTVHGMLTIGMTNNWALKEEMMSSELDRILDYLLIQS